MIKENKTTFGRSGLDMPNFVWTDNSVTMTGRAMPEFATLAWDTFIVRLKDYFSELQMRIFDRPKFTVNFCLDFYNSASSLFISTMFDVLQSNWGKADITVNWFFLKEDEDTEADGEMYRDSTLYNKIKVNIMERED